MNFEELCLWVEATYPEVKVFVNKDHSVSLEVYCEGECNSVNVSSPSEVGGVTQAAILNNEEGKTLTYFGEEYLALIIIIPSDKEEENIASLLHELGHHIECQKGNVLYKEIRAWQGAKKLYDKLNLTWSYVVNKYVEYCLSTYIEDHPNLYTDSLANQKDRLLGREVRVKKNPIDMWGYESWKRKYK